MANARPLPQAFQWLTCKHIRPSGWLAEQMQFDLNQGFVGHLDQLVPELITEDDIYGEHRRTLADKAKDVGSIAQDADWEVQYLWWNAETQSNWWDGFVRHAMLVGTEEQQNKVHRYIDHILSTQDDDGYIGIYAPDLRYQAKGENGELWAQAALFRVLIAYYEMTQNQDVLDRVIKAVERTMTAWPINESKPFDVTESYAGVGHGLVFTDVLDRLYQLTGKQQYLDYAHFLYRDYCRYPLCDIDIQLDALLDPDYRYQGHAVHTWEHLRPLLTAYFATGSKDLKAGLEAFVGRLPDYLTPSGAPIGDEFILGKQANATQVGYEYCSIHELLDGFTHMLQKTGEFSWADHIENMLFNAAQGARHPDGMGIAYLKTDNSYSMLGEAGVHSDGCTAHEVQTRYKYSPTHQEAAVCCVPNAGRIYPYYLKAMWMQQQNTIIKPLYGPSEFTTEIKGQRLTISEQTNYPAEHSVVLQFSADAPVQATLRCRLPGWAKGVCVKGANVELGEGWFEISGQWQGQRVEIQFNTQPQLCTDNLGDHYFRYGPLVYSLPIKAIETIDKQLPLEPFKERCYQTENGWLPVEFNHNPHTELASFEATAALPWGQYTPLRTDLGYQGQHFVLQPMAAHILRQVTFKPKAW